MKGENKKNWEFHGFASNPHKSYEAGKKGSVLATQASVKEATTPNASNQESSGSSSDKNKSKQNKSWQNPKGNSDKKKGSSED
jgi:hypothetical protein